jgi:hemerythrin
MALLTWSDEYSVGVDAMDDQHKEMIDLLNQLYEAMMANRALEVTGPLLSRLVDYCQGHFVAEENLMVKLGYPGLETHRARHRQLVDQVNEQVRHYEHEDLFVPIQLLHFLGDWVATHIQKEDKDYGPWLNKNGVR